jgi:hypothetical protein
VAALARQGHIVERSGMTTVEAEQAVLTGGATVVTPDSAWTGESSFSGGSYVVMPAGASTHWQVPAAAQPQLVLPVVDLRPGSPAVTEWSTPTRSAGQALGKVRHGRIGAQGTSPAPGALLPAALTGAGELPSGATERFATSTGGDAVVDAVMLEPLVSRYVIGGGGHTTAMLRSAAHAPRTLTVTVPGSGTAEIETYDAAGVLRRRAYARSTTVTAVVLPGGFTLIRR